METKINYHYRNAEENDVQISHQSFTERLKLFSCSFVFHEAFKI